MRRRDFLFSIGWAAAGLIGTRCAMRDPLDPRSGDAISLAEWSLHRAIQSGALDPLDFPVVARREYDIDAVEYVNTLLGSGPGDRAHLAEMRRRAADAGVRSLLIMCDGEGDLGDPDSNARERAVENHSRWIEAAAFLGCHSIRVNANGSGTRTEQQKLVADGLRRLCEAGDRADVNVLVENHGGLSSDAGWLVGMLRLVGHPRAGALPDFGNFPAEADRYDGVQTMMPFARAVSAKSYGFAPDGTETTIDYFRMMRIVRDSGYRGWIGIEYEGSALSEREGILATKALLQRAAAGFDGQR